MGMMIKKINKRAVSPVVATVLLIGMVVVIALIVFLWFRGFVGGACEKFERNCELTCDEVEFQTSYSGGTLYMLNLGNVPIYSIKIKLSGGGSHETKDIRDLSGDWPLYGLGIGKSLSTPVDSSGFTEMTVIPVLLGNSNDGQESFICEDIYGFKMDI